MWLLVIIDVVLVCDVLWFLVWLFWCVCIVVVVDWLMMDEVVCLI